MPYPADPLDHPNLYAAHSEMELSPQEIALYQRHLSNLYGSGGVDNKDGSRSSLYATTVGVDGKHYVVPTVWGGQILPPRDAINRAASEGFHNFPSYASPEEAGSRYNKLHSYMERDTSDYFRARTQDRFADYDPLGPPVRIDRRPQDDDGTRYEVPMRQRIGPEATAPRLPWDLPSSLDGMIRKYGRFNIAVGKRESTNIEDRRGQLPMEFYQTDPVVKTRGGTAAYASPNGFSAFDPLNPYKERIGLPVVPFDPRLPLGRPE